MIGRQVHVAGLGLHHRQGEIGGQRRQRTDRFAAFFQAMLEQGVHLPPSAFEAWFLSSAHDDTALDRVLDEACAVAANGLHMRLAKMLHYRAASNDFLVRAGVGWAPGVVGHASWLPSPPACWP